MEAKTTKGREIKMAKTTPDKAMVLETFDTLFKKRDNGDRRTILVAQLHSTQRLYAPGHEGRFDFIKRFLRR